MTDTQNFPVMTAKHNLSMVRGDTFSFDVRLSEMDNITVRSLFFTVKKRASDETPIFQKSFSDGITRVDDNTFRVRVAPEDTGNVSPGKYAYDLQIGVNMDTYTLLIGSIDILQDVTREG